jgi:hypothetical protein
LYVKNETCSEKKLFGIVTHILRPNNDNMPANILTTLLSISPMHLAGDDKAQVSIDETTSMDVSPQDTLGNSTMEETPRSMALHSEAEMEDISNPHHHDVLCGRGVTTNRHPGNESFRSLVSLNKVRIFASLCSI